MTVQRRIHFRSFDDQCIWYNVKINRHRRCHRRIARWKRPQIWANVLRLHTHPPTGGTPSLNGQMDFFRQLLKRVRHNSPGKCRTAPAWCQPVQIDLSDTFLRFFSRDRKWTWNRTSVHRGAGRIRTQSTHNIARSGPLRRGGQIYRWRKTMIRHHRWNFPCGKQLYFSSMHKSEIHVYRVLRYCNFTTSTRLHGQIT